MAGGETFTVIRQPERDRFGDLPVGTTVEFDLPGCQFAPGASYETTYAEQQIHADGAVYAPPGADVRATDQMRIRGDVYDVVAKPQDWGASAGVVIPVRLITG